MKQKINLTEFEMKLIIAKSIQVVKLYEKDNLMEIEKK